MSYTETHRTLLTLIRSTKYISHSELEHAFSKIVALDQSNEVPNETSLNSHITTINYRIGQHGFKIDKKVDQVSGELIYIFISTAADDKQNTTHSPKELEAINSIIDGIVEADDFSLGRVNANQIIAGTLGRTLGESEIFVDHLIDDGWFDQTTEERLVLTTRSLSELRGYLVDRFGVKGKDGKVYLCKQCNEIVTMGYLVDLGDCFHFRCYEIFHKDGGDFDRIGVDPKSIV